MKLFHGLNSGQANLSSALKVGDVDCPSDFAYTSLIKSEIPNAINECIEFVSNAKGSIGTIIENWLKANWDAEEITRGLEAEGIEIELTDEALQEIIENYVDSILEGKDASSALYEQLQKLTVSVRKGEYEQTEFKGSGYSAYVLTPEGDTSQKKLVIWSPGNNGFDGTMQTIMDQVKTESADVINVFMKNTGLVASTLEGFIEQLSETYNIDKNNITLVGYSAGANAVLGAANSVVQSELNGNPYSYSIDKVVSISAGTAMDTWLETLQEDESIDVLGVVGNSGDGANSYMTGKFSEYFDVVEMDGCNHDTVGSTYVSLDSNEDGVEDIWDFILGDTTQTVSNYMHEMCTEGSTYTELNDNKEVSRDV